MLSLIVLAAGPARADLLYVSLQNSTIYTDNTPPPTPTPTLFATTPAGSSPYGLGFDSSGNLYVASESDGTIYEYNPGGMVSIFATPPGAQAMAGLAVSASGEVYAVDSEGNNIYAYSPNGTLQYDILGMGGSPYAIAIDSSGNIYVSLLYDSSTNVIEEFSATLTDLGTFVSTSSNYVDGLAFDSSGNLYAAYALSNVIEEFSSTDAGPGVLSTGMDLGPFASSDLSGPQGIAFDSQGNLYVANSVDSIAVFNSSGEYSSSISTVAVPAFLAFPEATAVPEPATILGVVIGILGLLVPAWRRRGKGCLPSASTPLEDPSPCD